MKLDEYLWRNKIKRKDFAKKTNIEPHSLSNIVNGRVSPKLYTAINIVEATEGIVSYRDLLREDDLKNLSIK